MNSSSLLDVSVFCFFNHYCPVSNKVDQWWCRLAGPALFPMPPTAHNFQQFDMQQDLGSFWVIYRFPPQFYVLCSIRPKCQLYPLDAIIRSEHVKSARGGDWFDTDDSVTFPLAPPSGERCILAQLLSKFWVEQHFQYVARSVKYFLTEVASGALEF